MNDHSGWWLDEYDAPRFWQYVARGNSDHHADPLATAEGDCWVWTGAKDRAGYGKFRMGPKNLRAHRVAYLDGSRDSHIPEGWEIDHLCRNPACVRPSHLEPVEHAVNVARGLRGVDAVTHCPNGHEYSAENTTYGTRNGRRLRRCSICLKASKRRTYLRTSREANEMLPL